MPATATLELSRDVAGVAIVDIQERLAAVMPEAALAQVVRNARILIEAARLLGLPVVVSEQYPQGLGPTLPAVEQALAAVPGDRVQRVAKQAFACPEVPEWARFVGASGRRQWVLAGMEFLVCVYQSARALVREGHAVHVPQDAVVSRSPDNHRVGLALIERAGAIVTSTETVVFDLLKRAGTEEFKTLSRLVR